MLLSWCYQTHTETTTLENWEQCYYLKTALRGAWHVNSVQITSISHYTSRETLGVVHVPYLSDRSFLYCMLSSCFATVIEGISSWTKNREKNVYLICLVPSWRQKGKTWHANAKMHYAYKSLGRFLIRKVSVIQNHGVWCTSHLGSHREPVAPNEQQQLCWARETREQC